MYDRFQLRSEVADNIFYRPPPKRFTLTSITSSYMLVLYFSHQDSVFKHILSQVGLQAEETVKPMPGAGLCPGYTISRAILADAVCLTRGDRFLTVNFTRMFCPIANTI